MTRYRTRYAKPFATGVPDLSLRASPTFLPSANRTTPPRPPQTPTANTCAPLREGTRSSHPTGHWSRFHESSWSRCLSRMSSRPSEYRRDNTMTTMSATTRAVGAPITRANSAAAARPMFKSHCRTEILSLDAFQPTVFTVRCAVAWQAYSRSSAGSQWGHAPGAGFAAAQRSSASASLLARTSLGHHDLRTNSTGHVVTCAKSLAFSVTITRPSFAARPAQARTCLPAPCTT
jgi:hypothetical protein